jgi:hypothetical protein
MSRLVEISKNFNILSIIMIYHLFDNIFLSMATKMSRKDPDSDQA